MGTKPPVTKMTTRKNTPLTVETLKHDEAKRKNIPTAEYQSVMAGSSKSRCAWSTRAQSPATATKEPRETATSIPIKR